MLILISMVTAANQTFHNRYLRDEILAHAKPNSCYCNIQNGDQVAARGLLGLLQLKELFENDLLFVRLDSVNSWKLNSMDCAAVGGYLEVVKWLSDRVEWCPNRVLGLAARFGHLDIVIWLHEYTELKHRVLSSCSMDFIAADGHRDVIRWFYENRAERCSEKGIKWAIKNGHWELVQFLQAHKN